MSACLRISAWIGGDVPDQLDATEQFVLDPDVLGEGQRRDRPVLLPVDPVQQDDAGFVADFHRRDIGVVTDHLLDDAVEDRCVFGDHRLEAGANQNGEGVFALDVELTHQVVGRQLLGHLAGDEGDDQRNAPEAQQNLVSQR